MTRVDSAVCSPEWLALREEADAAARSTELVAHLAGLSGTARDLGSGTGAMTRWLAPRLPGITEWVLQDSDPRLLARAAQDCAAPVTALHADLAELRARDLAATALVTSSALLDLLTAEELDAIVAACLQAGCAALLTLNVTGEVVFEPAEPLDREFAAAFNDHQRRTVAGRRLLGPDAGGRAARALARGGAALTWPSPWRLGSARPELTASWLDGWLGAACAQRPELAAHAEAYQHRRLDECAAGRLVVTVGHLDVLHLPAGGRR
ncbi:methyltransferase domain-containing protein [Saccharopolyspora griseoalba]|uniref:Methyltransferase domain-containing protein n=1 Tax=Saccharopolyspora griseoalba TaxID=1431848 RepID=A0ABW2LMP0_9PSEU